MKTQLTGSTKVAQKSEICFNKNCVILEKYNLDCCIRYRLYCRINKRAYCYEGGLNFSLMSHICKPIRGPRRKGHDQKNRQKFHFLYLARDEISMTPTHQILIEW